jgi:hypothetical protein
LESYLSTVLLYSRVAVLFASMVTELRLALLFVLVFAGIMLAGPRAPEYAGPSNVREVGLEFFRKHIDTKGNVPASASAAAASASLAAAMGSSGDAAKNQAMNYIVEFYSASSESCRNFASEYARASLHYGYGGSNVTFVRISLDAFPQLAAQFQIAGGFAQPSSSGGAPGGRFAPHSFADNELPTLMMFQGSKVLARLPETGKKTMMNELNMIRAFDLEARALVSAATLAQLSKKEGAASAASKKDKKNA